NWGLFGAQTLLGCGDRTISKHRFASAAAGACLGAITKQSIRHKALAWLHPLVGSSGQSARSGTIIAARCTASYLGCCSLAARVRVGGAAARRRAGGASPRADTQWSGA